VAYYNWFALPAWETGFWCTCTICLAGVFEDGSEQNVMRNVVRFRIRGHGLKCETGFYGRSPDRSARVCNLCENGDYIQDEKHVIFSCIGTEHLRHQFYYKYLIIFLKVMSKVSLFDITHSLVQMSIFLIDSFVGIYRLSSHARLEALFQTKLN